MGAQWLWSPVFSWLCAHVSADSISEEVSGVGGEEPEGKDNHNNKYCFMLNLVLESLG